MLKKKSTVKVAAVIAATALPCLSWALEGGHEFELVSRVLYWNDTGVKTQVTTAAVAYEQSAVGVQAKYKSPFWANVIGVDATLLGVVKLRDAGSPTTSILEVGNDGQVADNFAALSQAVVKLKAGDFGQINLGRQTQTGLLLQSSTSRAAPDTFSGVSAVLTPFNGTRIHAAIYDKWRARSSPNFEKFKTESTAAGGDNAIDYIVIGGAKYGNGPYEVTAEYLNAKDYLAKYGVVVSYLIPLQTDRLKLAGGIFGSRDAGRLFVCGAEKEMDCTGTGRLSHNARGVYLDADWKIGNATVGAAVSSFDGLWIEDNFAADAVRAGALNQDHGTNPFPTSSVMGPDFANNGETAWSLRLAYDWNHLVPGFKVNFKYVKGTGAKSSNLTNLATGSESYKETTLRYEPPFSKGLAASYIYGDYRSSVENYTATTNIKGLSRASWQLHRIYLDYTYKF